MAHQQKEPRRRLPPTCVAGVGLIMVSEAFLVVDVIARDGAIVPHDHLAPTEGGLLDVARFFAIGLTPICWFGLLLTLDGLLLILDRRAGHHPFHQQSPIRCRPRRFALCVLASVPIWLSFDWINFSILGAWDYHNLPENFLLRNMGYFFSFAAICPAMFLLAELYQRLGLRGLTGPSLRFAPNGDFALFALGAVCMVFPFLVQSPLGTLTLWIAWLFLLDPVNKRLGAPSLLGDLERAHWDRVVSLMVSGATCGLLWEFWNYWAVAKWTYDLSFLGVLEEVRYFEMPVVGMAGFPVFALECWVMFQTVVLLLEKLNRNAVERLPSNSAVL